MIKQLSIGIFLLTSLTTIAGVPNQALVGTAEAIGHPLLSPALGWAIKKTAVIENIRFMGPFKKAYKGDARDYTNDTSDDPLWNIVNIFFPSNAGTLQAYFAGNYNLAAQINALDSPEERAGVIAQLLLYITKKREEITDTKAVPKKEEFLKEMLALATKDTKFLNVTP